NVRKHVDEGNEVLKEVNKASRGILSVADVSTEEGRNKLFNDTRKNFGEPDILVNNAGLGILEPFESIQENHMQAMFNANLFSTIWMSKEFASISKHGVIINIASLAGISPFRGLSVYGMTKAAIISLTKSMALELAYKGIRVNAVAPGVVKTKMGESLLQAIKMDEEIFAKKYTLTGKLIEPEEVADAVLSLVSIESMTGQVITMDSGVEQMVVDFQQKY
ncbi:SDR family oxidoreductase, partial [Ferroplasma sp.]|uniref:SDR family oxidoreductase n=1 Tax=Ferroplasma sp. TaxID=2591003 RepID=UPI00307F0416